MVKSKNLLLFVLFTLFLTGFMFAQDPDAAMSEIGAELYTYTVGDTADIFVIVRDAEGNPLAGIDCAFSTSRDSLTDIVLDSPAVTDSTGTARAKYYTEVAGPSSVLVDAGETPLGHSDNIAWIAGPVDADACLLNVSEDMPTVGDVVTVTAIVTDTYGNPIADVEVAFNSDRPGDVIALSPAMTDEDGRASATVTSTEVGTSVISALADGNPITATASIDWQASTISTFIAFFTDADGMEMPVNLMINDGSTFSETYTDIATIEVEVPHNATYTVCYFTDDTTRVLRRFNLNILPGETSTYNFTCMNPADAVEREMPYVFFREVELGSPETMDFDYAANNLDIWGVEDFGNGFAGTVFIDNSICRIPGFVIDDLNYEFENSVNFGVFVGNAGRGIFADANVENEEAVSFDFASIPSYETTIGCKNVVSNNCVLINADEFESTLRRVDDGMFYDAEHVFPQYSVREGSYLFTPVLPDGFVSLELPVCATVEHPVIVDINAFLSTDLMEHLYFTYAEFIPNSGSFDELADTPEEGYLEISATSNYMFDWWGVIVLPATQTVATLYAIGDVTEELVENLDYTVTNVGDYNVVAIRVESGYGRLELHYRSSADVYYTINEGWNLIAYPFDVPVLLEDFFPEAITDAYHWNVHTRSYDISEDLEAGNGYYVYFNEPADVVIPLYGLRDISLTLYPGWNMIAGPKRTIDIENLTDYPEVIAPVYGYNPIFGRYFNAEQLVPGYGYWVLCADTVDVVLP